MAVSQSSTRPGKRSVGASLMSIQAANVDLHPGVTLVTHHDIATPVARSRLASHHVGDNRRNWDFRVGVSWVQHKRTWSDHTGSHVRNILAKLQHPWRDLAPAAQTRHLAWHVRRSMGCFTYLQEHGIALQSVPRPIRKSRWVGLWISWLIEQRVSCFV